MTKIKSPMLAEDYDPSLLKFPAIASPKIDGIRCHIVDGKALYRSGKPIKNNYIREVLSKQSLNGLDGELFVGNIAAPNVFNLTSSAVRKAVGEPDFRFVVFDCHANPNDPWWQRFDTATEIIADINNKHITTLMHFIVRDEAELDVFEQSQLEAGFEGVMLRDRTAPYKFGRSTVNEGYLLKVKRFSHDEATIVGFKEAMSNDNEATTSELGYTTRSTAKDGLYPSGMLGAYICVSEEYSVEFNISATSMTHAERVEALKNAPNDIGRALRFKHLRHGAKDAPRHGLFAGFRDAEDL